MGTSATSHVCDEASLGETSFGEARMRGDQVVDNARIREGRGVAKCVRLEGGDLEAGGWVRSIQGSNVPLFTSCFQNKKIK